MVDFNTLKRNRGKNDLQKQIAEVEKMNRKFDFPADERFWELQRDKSGNGFAVIRFLPPHVDEDLTYIRRYDHGFQGPGGWYIELCRSTIKQPDPVLEYNSELFAMSEDPESPPRKQVSRQKRRVQYISNIYVVKDPAHPETEGKVFLYKYGQKIWNRLTDAMTPPEVNGVPVREPMNPFDLWEGANFNLQVHTVVEGKNRWPNYDQSTFGNTGPLFKNSKGEPDEAKLRAIHEQEYPLLPLLDPSLFKSYDELKSKLQRVLGIGGSSFAKEAARDAFESTESSWSKQVDALTTSSTQPKADLSQLPWDDDEEEGEKVKSYFQELANRG